MYLQSKFYASEPSALETIDSSKAVALFQLSRNVFRRGPGMSTTTRLMTLQSLVMAATPFDVTDHRDMIFALQHLANDDDTLISRTTNDGESTYFAADYSKHLVDVLVAFCCIIRSPSIHFFHEAKCCTGSSTWIISSTAVQCISRLWYAKHHRPPAAAAILRAKGILLGAIQSHSCCNQKGRILARALCMLGWSGKLKNDVGDKLWRTFVANRGPAERTAPAWYRRACALALTHLNDHGDLPLAHLLAARSEPSMMMDYLERVQIMTESRHVSQCGNTTPRIGEGAQADCVGMDIVGTGPYSIKIMIQYAYYTAALYLLFSGVHQVIAVGRVAPSGSSDRALSMTLCKAKCFLVWAKQRWRKG
ncbi:hypothetical protein T440DRAFT_530636 [Plenodomus tracheiphilus IPT5]|uniref:Uncharacterized protein n=1 Tax=Plenodomus tracheiphilus IPT5 TaxID=1408161 RepID=A0A6A7B814_9PLEO|nr:hypothetical protein T440DRAFT_530636 [Plenodomus tracheiphilus IPT5]